MIHHLSAPTGHSINDHIRKEDFALHYSLVDDATDILTKLGKGAYLAKVDLKSAFRIIEWYPFGLGVAGNTLEGGLLCGYLPPIPLQQVYRVRQLTELMANRYLIASHV